MKNNRRLAPSEGISRLFESWSQEFQSKVDRVYNLIGGIHHGELGSNRETLFRNYLRSYLPDGWNVSTGFVVGEKGEVSKQQDVIIWHSSRHMPYLRDGEFAIVPLDSVLGLIEVKTSLGKRDLKDALECLHPPMYNNWNLGTSNPWNPDSGYRSVDVPFRGIFALRRSKRQPVRKIFDQIVSFYRNHYPAKQRGDIIAKHRQHLRYIHLIDCICVLEGISIHQTWLSNGQRDGQRNSVPGFAAWEFSGENPSQALAWFLFYLYREVNRKLVPGHVEEAIRVSRGRRAQPFICRLDGIKDFLPKMAAGEAFSQAETFQAKPGLWK